MHEYSLASAIINQVKQVAREHNATKVNKITVSADPYEMVIPELLQDAFNIITSELELFEGTQLELLRLPAEIICLDCDYKGKPSEEGDKEFAYNFKCPKCDSRDTHLNIRHLTIETVDLEIPE
ncbi:MAG: hydrogenase maturation nickel metallochaperone HypA [Candidatus Heimdallarchaeota archaeon]|nr:hydrogenase maturation nickel metallochaperone HypA [Candidatus Heimdallarchaeota archaeon]